MAFAVKRTQNYFYVERNFAYETVDNILEAINLIFSKLFLNWYHLHSFISQKILKQGQLTCLLKKLLFTFSTFFCRFRFLPEDFIPKTAIIRHLKFCLNYNKVTKSARVNLGFRAFFYLTKVFNLNYKGLNLLRWYENLSCASLTCWNVILTTWQILCYLPSTWSRGILT